MKNPGQTHYIILIKNSGAKEQKGGQNDSGC